MNTLAYFFRSLFLICLFLVVSCEETDIDPGKMEEETEPPSLVYFSLAAKNWDQDSLAGVYVVFTKLNVIGTEGERWTANLDSTKSYNLLELDETPLYLGMDTITAGRYEKLNVTMKTFLLKRKNESDTASYKAQLCHYPPGNPTNNHTLNIGPCSVISHLKHGDTPGACGTNGYTLGSTHFSHLKYNDGTINPLFAKDTLVSTTTLDLTIPEGDELDILLTLDPAKSIVPFLSLKEDCDDTDVYVFKPSFEVVILPRRATIAGSYLGTITAGRTYTVNLYKSGTYKTTEANVNTPFANALQKAPLSTSRQFTFSGIRTGKYDFVLAEFQANRYRRVVRIEKDIQIEANKSNTVVINP